MRRCSDVCSPREPEKKERGCHPRTNGAAEARTPRPGHAAQQQQLALGPPGSHRAQPLPPFGPLAAAGCASRPRLGAERLPERSL